MAFRDQQIEFDQLTELTDGDLRELGLTIGERKRFRRALANEPRLAATGQALAEKLPDADTRRQAERRPLTVMFVDLVGSTALGERIDPEDLLEIIRSYRDFCGVAIGQFGGHIARFLGDGILAYFGHPAADENDPERAVRAALEIVAGIGEVPSGSADPLKVRIGLATGRVIVSDLLGTGTGEKDAILGSCPNLAARLQTLAGENGIVVAERTHQHVRRRFVCEPLGELELRGFDKPQGAWRVLGLSDQSHEMIERQASATQFFGRSDELEMLALLWRSADRRKTALVTGEAGIGKSRLVEQFISNLPAETLVVRVNTSPFASDSPLRPFVDLLDRMAKIRADDSAAVIRTKLTAILAGDERERQSSASVLSGLFGLEVDDALLRGLSPPELRDRTISALTEYLLSIGGSSPLCLLVEDLHWLDPTSGDLLVGLIARQPERRVFFLLTGREESAPVWSGRVQATIRLGPLPPADVASMVEATAGHVFANQLSPTIIEHTDGVPLFVEEFTRLLLHNSATGGDETSNFSHPFIPDSLEESLMARLDRSGPAKAIAQAAAVIGRSARRDILAAVCNVTEQQLQQALDDLISLGILERTGRAPPDTYSFHHALLRDAAYASLLRRQRQDLHRDTAEAIQRIDPDGAALFPEILAEHLTEADLAKVAAPFWIEAARRSLTRSALIEATRLLRRGLRALEKLPTTPETAQLRLELSGLLGPALIGLKGPNSTETQEVYSSAYDLCRQIPEDPTHYPIYWGWWRLEPANLSRANALLDRARTLDDPELMLQAHHCAWGSHFQLASFENCHLHMRAGLAIYAGGDYRHHARLYGNHDARVCAHGCLSQIYWMEGKLRSAEAEDAEALSWASRLGHVGSLVHARGLTLLHQVYRRDYEQVLKRSQQLIDFTAEHRLADHGSAGLIFKGWVMAKHGEFANGLKTFEEGLARQREVATNEDFPVYFSLLGELLTEVGRPEEAVERINNERPGFAQSSLHLWVPELLRCLGEAMLAADPIGADKANAMFIEAAKLAEDQRASMLGLRVAVSRAHLAQRLGNRGEAAALLKTAIAAIAEPEAAKEIQEAISLHRRIA